jgi:hypothetical protein
MKLNSAVLLSWLCIFLTPVMTLSRMQGVIRSGSRYPALDGPLAGGLPDCVRQTLILCQVFVR